MINNFTSICLIALGSCAVISAQTDPRSDSVDRFTAARQIVNGVMKSPAGLHVSFTLTAARGIGDGIAVAIMKLTRLKELEDLDNQKRVMLLLEDAFSAPSLIAFEEDKNPGATLVLLTYLMEHSTDPRTKQRAWDLNAKLEASKAAR